ncbi:EAL domain-containing protein [Erythrobacter litoralis]|uniref:Sensory box/GGDEF family protein n=1 Tax=Erythrobacter litoralis (strain HTCC2594) TaxID=314225 RepID=Q2N9U3_ERYLH|nr:EAL domain-containing protein [Erythrobacter litoralis]ABC63548.1 sensory box/GGDEF family protein [Erythrobacter litoralis HTCC2594]
MGGHSASQQKLQDGVRDEASAPATARQASPTEAKPKPQKASDRERDDRRDPATARGIDKPRKGNGLSEVYFLPTNWTFMALLPLVAAVVGSLLTQALPSYLAIAAFVSSALFFGIASKVSLWERSFTREVLSAAAAAVAVTVVPSLLYGLALGLWVLLGDLPIAAGVMGVISFNAISATLLTGRPRPMYACLAASWAPLALMEGNPTNVTMFAVFAAGLAILSRYQAKIDRERAERRQTDERILNRAIDILRDYEETGNGWFWETDRRGLLTYVSGPVANRLGTKAKRLIGRPITELFDLAHDNREGERTIAFHLSARSAFQELPVKAAGIEEERWWSISGRPIFDSFQNFCGFRGSGTDLTEKRRSQEHASRLAHFDSLTGLANRHQMSQSLEKILASPKVANRECAVFLLDLDRFKHVNDTLGHPAGDALLKQVAERLESTVGNMGRVGRLGGDEFKVILPGRVPKDKLSYLAAGIIRSLSQPYSIEGQRVVIGVSIGIAISPENGESSEDVIRNADLALYAAKDGGRGRFHFYSNDLHSAAEERSQLERDLREAISEGQLELHYQPVVQTATERIAGFEALLRWKHPQHGYISPAKFIPIAEDTGLIQAIGEWAIRTACHDLASWPKSIRCAVNVSPLQFSNEQLPTIITSALAQAGVAPTRLELEITESVFLNDDEGTDAMFAALSGIGVRLALDDFGTGYSSLGYLKTAPFNKIKIDQSFVRGATVPGSRNGAIIASITSLAQELGMDTTAEGVETLDELDLVRMHGCSHIQGYIYEKPLNKAEATKRLETGLTAIARGPKSARAPRQSMLRKILLEHDGQHYQGTIRNISSTGALIEGLWNVPAGTIFRVAITERVIVTGTTRWSKEDRMGLEFATPLPDSEAGRIDLHISDTTFSLKKAAAG